VMEGAGLSVIAMCPLTLGGACSWRRAEPIV
jgi:hypothetical protein